MSNAKINKVYLVLYEISSQECGYHDLFLDRDKAYKEAEKMNETEKGMYYDYFVEIKELN